MKTLDPSRLTNIKRVITHANCPDGYASAAIVRDVLPNVPVTFLAYGTQAHAELPAEAGLLFVDMIPPRERAKEFADAGALVLDHHEKARDIVEVFGDDGIYTDKPGVSGALLAFRQIWLPLESAHGLLQRREKQVEGFARLVGIRDTWQTEHADWKEACALSAALMLSGEEPLLAPNLYLALIPVGHMLVKKREVDVEVAIAKAVSVRIGDRLAVVVNGLELISDVAENLGSPYDMVIGFAYASEPHYDLLEKTVDRTTYNASERLRLRLSLRTCRDDVDCGAFAVSRGGGGHRKSAGYSVEIAGVGVSPYQIIAQDLTAFWTAKTTDPSNEYAPESPKSRAEGQDAATTQLQRWIEKHHVQFITEIEEPKEIELYDYSPGVFEDEEPFDTVPFDISCSPTVLVDQIMQQALAYLEANKGCVRFVLKIDGVRGQCSFVLTALEQDEDNAIAIWSHSIADARGVVWSKDAPPQVMSRRDE